MQATLQVTKKLTVNPLIDIENSIFADTYSRGLWRAMHGEYQGKKPVPDSYLVDNLKREASKGAFDGQHTDGLPHLLGFYFGMLHGSILEPHTSHVPDTRSPGLFGMLHGSILEPHSGQLRPDVVALATFTHPDTVRGYAVARRDYFFGTNVGSLIQTDRA
jgi:hypothetical protein